MFKTVYINLGESLKGAREEIGIRQTELAGAIKASGKAISKYEGKQYKILNEKKSEIL